MELQTYSNAIEGAICAFDEETDQSINDTVPIRVIELFLDKYHFKDKIVVFNDELTQRLFHCVESVIESDLSEVPNETLVRILRVLHFVAKRRSRGGREYLEVINQYVGARIAKGVRVRRSV